MGIELDIEKKDGYIYATYKGEYKGELETLHLNNLLDACKKHSCSKVLVEIVECSLSVSELDRYLFAKEVAKFFCMPNPVNIAFFVKPDQYDEFVETMARNRGVDCKIFTNKTEAINWLSVS